MLFDMAQAPNPETGTRRGYRGENTILVDERKPWAYELYNKNGVPEAAIESGLYWRTHPKGRKVNSDESRKANGSGWYRS